MRRLKMRIRETRNLYRRLVGLKVPEPRKLWVRMLWDRIGQGWHLDVWDPDHGCTRVEVHADGGERFYKYESNGKRVLWKSWPINEYWGKGEPKRSRKVETKTWYVPRQPRL